MIHAPDCKRDWNYRYPKPLRTFVSVKDKLLRCGVKLLAAVSELLYSLQDTPVWISSDGSVTPIADLDNTHLVNATAILMRERTHSQKRVLPFMQAEVSARGLDTALATRSMKANRW